MLRVLVCSVSAEVGEDAAAKLASSGKVVVTDVLTDLNEVMDRVNGDDYDVCLVGLNSFSWFDKLSSHIHRSGSGPKKCALLAPRMTSESLLLAMRCKANALLDMGKPVEDLVQILHGIVAGRTDLTRDRSVAHVHTLSPENSVLRLCRDELDVEILSHLIEGRPNEMIADLCNIAIQTVRNRLVRLMAVAEVDNRTQLATLLLRI